MISEKHEKVSRPLKYFEYFLVFISAVSACVSISTFASIVAVPVGIASSAIGTKICITGGIKKYQSTINKKRKKHNKIVLLAKTKFNTTEDLISKALINS